MDLSMVSLVGITTLRTETIVWYYELMTAPSYIHTYIEVQSRKSTRKEFSVHDHKGAYAHAYATILYFNFIVNIDRLQCIATAAGYNQCKPVQPTVNINRTQVQHEQHMNST